MQDSMNGFINSYALRTLLCLSMCCGVLTTFAQQGRVGIGTSDDIRAKLEVAGGLLVTSNTYIIGAQSQDSLPEYTIGGGSATDSSGVLYDSGGADGDYSANEELSFVINPSGADFIRLTFEEFETEEIYDSLQVFGYDASGSRELLYTYSGTSTGNVDLYSFVELIFRSNSVVNMPGFKIRWDKGYTVQENQPEVDGGRLQWIPDQYALRSGYVASGSDAWDYANIGRHSTAFGFNTKASAYVSLATGFGTSATGQYSTSMGFQTIASDFYAFAWGDSAMAIGPWSTAFGFETTASGPAATTWGNTTSASGTRATAWGFQSVASQFDATAWGGNSVASGIRATAWGFQSAASQIDATAWGQYSVASGNISTAWGQYSVASGQSSTAWGDSAMAIGPWSTAFGFKSTASGSAATTWGNQSSASGTRATAWGFQSEASQFDATAWGDNSVASGNCSTAWGFSTEASGIRSAAWGFSSIASGPQSTAWGQNSIASGASSTAWCQNSIASGSFSTAWGFGAEASASYSTAWGNQTEASGEFSTSWGESTFADSRLSTALGRYNVGGGNPFSWDSQDPLFEIGIGTSTGNRANALTVLKNGNLGILTHTPEARLHILNGTETSGGSGGFLITGSLQASNIGIDNNEIQARNNGSPSTLFVNIAGGTVLTGSDFESGGDLIADVNAGVLNAGGGAMTTAINYIGDSYALPTNVNGDEDLFIQDDLQVGSVAYKPGGGSWSTASDARLKQEINPFELGLDAILAVKPVTYKYNSRYEVLNTGETYVGVLAQDMLEVAPFMVSRMPFGQITTEDENGVEQIVEQGTEYFTYDGSALPYMIVNAIKEQQQLITEQQATLEAQALLITQLIERVEALEQD